MKLSKTLMMTAAVVVLSTGAMAAEGAANTDGTHNANNTQTDTNMGVNANQSSSNDAASDVNTNASTEAEMSDTGNDVSTDTNASTQTSVGVSTNMDRATIENAQTALREQGLDVSVDGKMGPQTMAAIREFQEQNGLSVTGTLDSSTMAALSQR